MGKLSLYYLKDDVNLNLLDLLRGQVAVALEILMQSPKTKAEYGKSFKSALQVVQNMKKLLSSCTETTDDSPEKSETEKSQPSTSHQTRGKNITGSIQEIRRAPDFEPTRKVAKTKEVQKKTVGAKSTTVLKNLFDGRTPAQKALANSLIVQKMMDKLFPKALKSCRGVCKLWEDEATKQLLTSRHNQSLEVKFQWSKNSGDYKHISLGTLQSFIDFCLKKSRRFPCVQFDFHGGNFSSSAILNFFTDFGANVKFLQIRPITINVEESSLALKTLGRVLFELAPNLEGLFLSSIDWTRDQDFPMDVKGPAPITKRRSCRLKSTVENVEIQKLPQNLPNLKMIALPYERRNFPKDDSEMNLVVLRILRAAPNLVEVEDEFLYFTREIVAAGKFGLFNFLWFDFDYLGHEAIVERYAYFSQQQPQLEVIEFLPSKSLLSRNDMQNSLTEILRSSHGTLKTIHELHNLDFEKYTIPPLNSVEHLVFEHPNSNWTNTRVVLTSRRKLVDYFPNLTQITCCENFLKDSAYSSETVTSLFLTFKLQMASPELIIYLEYLYPNLTLLSLTFDDRMAGRLPETFKAICSSFPRLETMKIHMNITETGWFWCSEMDAAFTGLPLSMCKNPMEGQLEKPNAKTLQNLEANGQPSIRDLTRLKKLQICLEQKSIYYTVHRLCTRVSDLYAFDLMKRRQGLKVEELVRN